MWTQKSTWRELNRCGRNSMMIFDRVQWQAFVIKVMVLWLCNLEFLDHSNNYQQLKKASTPWNYLASSFIDYALQTMCGTVCCVSHLHTNKPLTPSYSLASISIIQVFKSHIPAQRILSFCKCTTSFSSNMTYYKVAVCICTVKCSAETWQL